VKVCVVTSTRADFGLLRGLMTRIEESRKLDLQVMVTGAHLMSQFGNTLEDIVDAGFSVDWRVTELSAASTGADVANQVGEGISGFSRGFQNLAPDVVVLLGDRYEILSAAIAAFFLEIPVLHLHGGEVTHGAFDDAIRHSISKFARTHGVAEAEYAERLIRAGEQPDSVHIVGGLGVDEILRTTLLPRQELESSLELALDSEVFLVTYHPVTAGAHDSRAEVDSLIAALDSFPAATVIFTMPGADPDHQIVLERITEAVATRSPRWHFFRSLGQQKYLSLLALASAVVGNSSSGILEAPTVRTPTVNIGSRQAGRLMAHSVIQAEPTTVSVIGALNRAISPEFQSILADVLNPYGTGGAVDKIMGVLEETDFSSLGPKIYYDEAPHTKVN
jgi:GDP/UDP-N,N'-diacetylbacillosamine 2-epimerase (hydrolysing)